MWNEDEYEELLLKPRKGSLCFIYGDEKSGKTSYCLMVSSSVLKDGGSVVWVDCGARLSLTRVEQVLSANNAPPDKLYITSPMDFDSQEKSIVNIVSFPPKGLGLIVCDDFTYLHRIAISGNPRVDLPIYKRLAFQVALLKETCLNSGVACILVGHVREKPEKDGREPVASRIITYWADVVLNFVKTDSGRVLRVEKPDVERREHKFEIIDAGLRIFTYPSLDR